MEFSEAHLLGRFRAALLPTIETFADHCLSMSRAPFSNRRGRNVWGDTTTLYTRLLRGHVEAGDDPGAEIIASGILRISPLGFLRQLVTFRAGGSRSAVARAAAIVRFDALFVGHLWEVYGLHRVYGKSATQMKRPNRGSSGRGDRGC